MQTLDAAWSEWERAEKERMANRTPEQIAEEEEVIRMRCFSMGRVHQLEVLAQDPVDKFDVIRQCSLLFGQNKCGLCWRATCRQVAVTFICCERGCEKPQVSVRSMHCCSPRG